MPDYRLWRVAFFMALATAIATTSANGRTTTALTTVCAANSFEVSFPPSGQIRVLEYHVHYRDVRPTGRQLVYMDATTMRAATFCKTTTTKALKAQRFIGPFHRGPTITRVFCMRYPFFSTTVNHPRYGKKVLIQIRPLLNNSRVRVGSKMVVAVDRIPVVTATVTARGGTISYDFARCIKNPDF